MNAPIQISENCWKHMSDFGSFFYRKTSNPTSDVHRENGPAIEYANGNKAWYINNKLHREDGPAIEYTNGYREWCINGLLHRIGGPAIEYVDRTTSWYYKGKYIPFKENLKLLKKK